MFCSTIIHFLKRSRCKNLQFGAAKFCKDKGFLIPVLKKPKTDEEKEKLKYGMDFGDDSDEEEEDEGGYEGAIVLKPHPGIYLDKYVTVLDYSSLYPSSMISENLSHDTYEWKISMIIWKDTNIKILLMMYMSGLTLRSKVKGRRKLDKRHVDLFSFQW